VRRRAGERSVVQRQHLPSICRRKTERHGGQQGREAQHCVQSDVLAGVVRISFVEGPIIVMMVSCLRPVHERVLEILSIDSRACYGKTLPEHPEEHCYEDE